MIHDYLGDRNHGDRNNKNEDLYLIKKNGCTMGYSGDVLTKKRDASSKLVHVSIVDIC